MIENTFCRKSAELYLKKEFWHIVKKKNAALTHPRREGYNKVNYWKDEKV